jgi:pyridoxal phosphate enzyme (YggS family)
MSSLSANLARLEDEIAAACRSANRPRAEVELVAVSKTHPAPVLAEAVGLGLSIFGENRVQEFEAKSAGLGAARRLMRVHLIGHLQSNKAAKAAELFDGIDTVDSLKLAERLNAAAETLNTPRPIPILLEIKLSPEESKAGLDSAGPELTRLLERLPGLTRLDLQGLMTIAPLNVPEDQTRACFRALAALRNRLTQAHPRLNLPVLSMGMSGDFPLAIAEGATRIRVGAALFGAREYPAVSG